jgi:outer membrane protein TolC
VSDSINESFGTDFPTYTAVLSFDVPLFNRTARNARRGARVGLQSARLLYDDIEQGVVSDVRARVRDLNFQAKAVQAAHKSLELAQRQLQAEQARYREGLSTTFQVLQFQEDLAQALSAEKAARAAYARASAGLQRSEGWLGEQR